MSLSEREQRILSEIERDLSVSAPSANVAPFGAWLSSRSRPAMASSRRVRGADGNTGLLAAMMIGLLAGIAILSAGLALDVPSMMIGGAVLTQLSPAVSWLARLARGRPSRTAGVRPRPGQGGRRGRSAS